MKFEDVTKPILHFMTVGLTLCPFLLNGCADSVSKLFSSDIEAKVPLENFASRDGHYFPNFVLKFFPNAKLFCEARRKIDAAREGMQLIEVRSLSSEMLSYNEANLSWSADGVFLGFEVVTESHRKILVKDLVGNYSKELLMLPKGRNDFLEGMVSRSIISYNAGLRWSRDSTRFAFMSNGGVGIYNIYVGAVGVKEEKVTQSSSKDGYANWSPVSSEIAFVSGRSGSGDIYLVNLSSRETTRLSSSPDIDIFPEWFPNAQKIVYSSGDALNHDLFVVERDQLESNKWDAPRALTSWPCDDLRPVVSPDGKNIAFYADDCLTQQMSDQVSDQIIKDDFSQAQERIWNLHVVPYIKGKTYKAEELKKTIIARDVVIDLNTGPAWTPDGRGIFYVKRDPKNFNPIYGYDLFAGQRYFFKTSTKMNRDILMSKLGVLSFRAQVGVWDRVFLALTNQGLQLQKMDLVKNRKIIYERSH